MDRRSSRRRIIDSTSVPSCRRKDRKQICDQGDIDLSKSLSDDPANDGDTGKDLHKVRKINDDDVTDEAKHADADTGIDMCSQQTVPLDDVHGGQTAQEVVSSGHGGPTAQEVVFSGHGSQTAPEVVSSGHGSQTALEVVSSGHGSQTALEVVSSGHGSQTAQAVVSSGHGGPTAPEVVFSGHGGPTAPAVVSSGHGDPTAPEVVFSGHGGPTAPEVVSSGHGGPTAPEVVSSGHGDSTAPEVVSSGHGDPTAPEVVSSGHGDPMAPEVVSDTSNHLNTEQSGVGESKSEANDYIHDQVETKVRMHESESAFDHIDRVPKSSQMEQKGLSKCTKPWMLPENNIRKESLYPAIPEEIHQELIDRDFLLPWRSIDLDETYIIHKSKSRRSGGHRSSSESKKQTAVNKDSKGTEGNAFPNATTECVHEADTIRKLERRDSFSLELIESDFCANNIVPYECSFQRTRVKRGLETKDPYSIELEKTKTDVDTPNGNYHSDLLEDILGSFEQKCDERPTLGSLSMAFDILQEARGTLDEDTEEAFSNLMEDPDGTPRLLTVEEKWQIIFNEKTRAPIFAVGQYVEYLSQYVTGKGVAAKDKDRISPVSYLLRKLKLDLKMSYDSFVEEFLKPGNNGMALLVKLLKFIQNTGTQQSGSANKAQVKNYKKTLTDEHDCLLCIKFALRIKTGLTSLLEVNYGLETIAMSLLSSFTKSRGTAIEILTITLAAAEGFSRTLDSFTYIQLKIGEPVRFKSLMNMMNMDSHHNTIFKVSCMKFMNCLLDAATNLNVRVYLQHELETAGLDVTPMVQKTTGTGLEFDELRYELSEWSRKYIRVDEILSQKNLLAQKTHSSQQDKLEELQRKLKMLTLEKTTLEHQLRATRNNLERSNEELQRRVPSEDKGTQVPGTRTVYRDVACQCSHQDKRKLSANPLFDVKLNGAWQTSSSLPVDDDAVATLQFQPEDDELDEHGVEKVKQWLDSQSDVNIETTDTADSYPNNKQKSVDGIVRKAEFPGNWRLIPKSVVPFPSRFSTHRCHKTNCDRCDIRNRPENVPRRKKQEAVVQTVSAEFSHEEVIIPKKKLEIKSESSDSAIGGSGDRWQTKENRIPLLPPEVNEADILQDMIEPDDSASGCRSNEPFPDYSVVSDRIRPQKSFRSELSEVLREFEGNLNEHDSQESFSNFNNLYTGHFVTLGQV